MFRTVILYTCSIHEAYAGTKPKKLAVAVSSSSLQYALESKGSPNVTP